MLERDVEKRLVRLLRAREVLTFKWVSPGQGGVPDRIAVLPGGHVCFIELKTDTGRLSPLQKNMIARLRQQGADVRVLYGSAGVDEFITEVDNHEIQTVPVSETGGAVDT